MKAIGRMQGSRAEVWITMLAIFGTRTGWAGDNIWTSLGPDGGSILAIDPHDPATVYAGTDMWGVYKTTDGGGTWTAGSPPLRQVSWIAIDPKHSATIYRPQKHEKHDDCPLEYQHGESDPQVGHAHHNGDCRESSTVAIR